MNLDSLTFLQDKFTATNPDDLGSMELLNPQLLEGAWNASAARITEIVADYELTGDLARSYGRIEELRWRLRYRTEHRDKQLDTMMQPLIDELHTEVAHLLEGVTRQIADPSAQPIGLVHTDAATVVGTGTPITVSEH